MKKQLLNTLCIIGSFTTAGLRAQRQQQPQTPQAQIIQRQPQHPQIEVRRPAADAADSRDRKVWDDGQVRVPTEGQVEDLPDGQVEPINPTAVQIPIDDQQRDPFQFESRSFDAVPSTP